MENRNKISFASDAEQCGDKLAFTEGPTILFLIDTSHSGETVLQGDHINLNVWECYIMDKSHNPLDLTAFWICCFMFSLHFKCFAMGWARNIDHPVWPSPMRDFIVHIIWPCQTNLFS